MITALQPHGLTPSQVGALAMWARRKTVYGPSGSRYPGKATAAMLRARRLLLKNKRTCRKGHTWTAANTYWSRSGRRCRACHLLGRAKRLVAQRQRADVGVLRAKMISAHPDRGGTVASFIKARHIYLRVSA